MEKQQKKEHEKTVSLSISQIEEIIQNPGIGSSIVSQMKNSEGNLTGKIAFKIAKETLKQLEIRLQN